MRGIVVGAILSVFLWTVLAWAVVSACTWLDVPLFSASVTALMSSLACINLAAMAAAIWLALVCADEEQQDATAFASMWIE